MLNLELVQCKLIKLLQVLLICFKYRYPQITIIDENTGDQKIIKVNLSLMNEIMKRAANINIKLFKA